MPVFWLKEDSIIFPHPELANEDGILAVGGDLSVNRLVYAYSIGLFPWFNPKDPILWWSPDPRFVLFPNELKISKSMRPYFNQQKFRVSFDQEFEQVIKACATHKREGQRGGTWITKSMINAYIDLHRAGWAHSVEVWQDDQLVGGLYGVSVGKVFFGESMFTRVSNASKFGFICLVKNLIAHDFNLIDCQQPTVHLGSMGARSIRRYEFLDLLRANEDEVSITGDWSKIMKTSF